MAKRIVTLKIHVEDSDDMPTRQETCNVVGCALLNAKLQAPPVPLTGARILGYQCDCGLLGHEKIDGEEPQAFKSREW